MSRSGQSFEGDECRVGRGLAWVLLGLGAWVGGCVAEYEAAPEAESSGTAADDSTSAADDTEAQAETETRPTCEPDEELCDDTCIDPGFDSEHCGGCGEACLLGTSCVAGECVGACGPTCDDEFHVCDQGVCRCRPGLLNCNGVCVNAEGDPEHCGDCWDECDATAPLCGEGECQVDCDDFQQGCEDTCTDTRVDPLNCGFCGRVCEAGQLCAEGDCVPYEPIDEGQCDECPCEVACEALCCGSAYLDTLVCVEGPDCPED